MKELKAIGFLDARTSEVTITTVLFTPQPASYPDIMTLLKVTFHLSQYGGITSEITVDSVAETQDSWKLLWGVSILSSVTLL